MVKQMEETVGSFSHVYGGIADTQTATHKSPSCNLHRWAKIYQILSVGILIFIRPLPWCQEKQYALLRKLDGTETETHVHITRNM